MENRSFFSKTKQIERKQMYRYVPQQSICTVAVLVLDGLNDAARWLLGPAVYVLDVGAGL